MSQKSGIVFIGMTDQVEEELEQIRKEQEANSPQLDKKPSEKS